MAEVPNLPGIDMKAAMQNFDNDRELYKIIFKSFHKTHLHSGKAIETFLVKGEIESASRLSHNLKGTAANLAANQLSLQAAKLEQACLNSNVELAMSMMAELHQHLDEVMSGIYSVEKNESEVPINASTMVYESSEVIKKLDQLQFNLDADYAEAECCVKALRAYIVGGKREKMLKNIEAAMESFDTNQAKAHVLMLKSML